MQPQFQEEDEDFGAIDFENQPTDEDIDNSAIDLDEYSKSEEAKEVSWWDWTKDVAIQSIRGTAQAFTWPLDVLKIGLVGEALSDLDELEQAFYKAGKPFDRDQYIKSVMEQGEYIPTQSFFEGMIEDATGVSLEPKTPSGKFINKASNIAGLTKGKFATKAASGLAAASTTQALKYAGANEVVSEVLGDLGGGVTQAIKKSTRQFTPEVEALRKVAEKHNIPFYEFMTKPDGGIITPKISKAREEAIMKELGISSEQAAKAVIEGKIPLSKLRSEGFNLAQLEKEAYDEVDQLASAHKKPISTEDIVDDINKEIYRVKKTSASPSDAETTYMKILKEESEALTNPPQKQAVILDANGKPLNPSTTGRLPKEISAEQLIKQHKNYNSNVKGIYRKPEFSGREEAVRDAYAFLNQSIRKTMGKQGGKDLSESFKEANSIFNQRAILNRSEALIDKAFVNGEYSPKKLKQLLNSRQGQILKRDLGEDAIKQITEISEYGQKAVNHTTQLLKSPKYAKEAFTWGNLAPFVLGNVGKMTGALYLGKPIAERVKGYLLTRPATREAYHSIIKNASKGSFNNMKSEFSKLDQAVNDEFGSSDDLIKKVMTDLEIYKEEI